MTIEEILKTFHVECAGWTYLRMWYYGYPEKLCHLSVNPQTGLISVDDHPTPYTVQQIIDIELRSDSHKHQMLRMYCRNGDRLMLYENSAPHRLGAAIRCMGKIEFFYLYDEDVFEFYAHMVHAKAAGTLGDDFWIDGSLLVAVRGLPRNPLVIPEGVAKIGDGAFLSCHHVARVVLADSVTQIGSGAFSGHDELKKIRFSNSLLEIGSWAFENCAELTALHLPSHLTRIGSFAFANCTGLTSLYFPGQLTCIDCNAFEECTGLTEVTLPDSLNELGPGVFDGCSENLVIHIGSNEKIRRQLREEYEYTID